MSTQPGKDKQEMIISDGQPLSEAGDEDAKDNREQEERHTLATIVTPAPMTVGEETGMTETPEKVSGACLKWIQTMCATITRISLQD